jgi:hypothetical protein
MKVQVKKEKKKLDTWRSKKKIKIKDNRVHKRSKV